MRNSLLAAALAAAGLAAGCGREAPPASSAEPHADLSTPARMVVNPFAGAAAGYTNDMQVRNLQDQASSLGIKRFTQMSTVEGPETHDVVAPVGFEEGLDRTRAMTHSLAVQRRAIDAGSGRTDSVPLVGDTPRMIVAPNGPTGGSAVTGAVVPDLSKP